MFLSKGMNTQYVVQVVFVCCFSLKYWAFKLRKQEAGFQVCQVKKSVYQFLKKTKQNKKTGDKNNSWQKEKLTETTISVPQTPNKIIQQSEKHLCLKICWTSARVVGICGVLTWGCAITLLLCLFDTEVQNLGAVRTRNISAVVPGASLNLEQWTITTSNSVVGESYNLRGRQVRRAIGSASVRLSSWLGQACSRLRLHACREDQRGPKLTTNCCPTLRLCVCAEEIRKGPTESKS